MFLVTNGTTSQSKVKVKHLKPNQLHKMIVNNKTLATFPKTVNKSVNSSISIDKKAKSTFKNGAFNEELLDDIDELNEEHLNLLKDTELLQSIAMTEKDVENKYNFGNVKEKQEIVNIDDSIKVPKSKGKL